ncbi:MAG TPA: S53 family peptidase [Methylocystis sp.]|nr:S53 family peptidase [Methylocystis sp.]
MASRVASMGLAVALLASSQPLGFSHGASAGALFGQARIAAPIDDAALVEIKNNVARQVSGARDLGAVADDFSLARLELQLQRSPEQEAAVEAFIEALHNPRSPLFHNFLSPSDFGARFGVAAADIDAIRSWLQSHGFTVDFVHPSNMLIVFSGTAGMVRTAFRTEIHQIDVNGAAHIANIGNPFIPAALQPVVAGVVSLTDFRAHAKHKKRSLYTKSQGCNGPCYIVTPSDLATIYNFNPLFEGSPPITGRGQTIAVVEDSNLYDNNDWTDFRQAFGLSKYPYGALEVVHPAPIGGPACADPGDPLVTLPDGVQLFDDDEATLDAEWASAAAPDATIRVATCQSTKTTDGVREAIENLVNGADPPPIVSISYGQCEADMPETLRVAFKMLYQQAVAEGISIFVATGDTGPESCVEDIIPSPTGYSPAQATGNGVDGWVSTPYDVAVGGTDFGDAYLDQLPLYWEGSSAKPWGSAKSYIPEIPWNDTCASALTAAYYDFSVSYGAAGFCNSSLAAQLTQSATPVLQPLTGTNGGPSACATGDLALGTCKGYPKPSWQRSVPGLPADGVRDLPDISFFASDGSVWRQSYALCYSNPKTYGTPCVGDPGTWAGPGNGGTSFAAPIAAGLQALVNQKMDGARQGNPNYVYYPLAAWEYGPGGVMACASSLGDRASSHCVFYDVVAGDNVMDCADAVDCYAPSGAIGVESSSSVAYAPTYRAGVGYDLATGIGTVNAANLVNSWAAATR